MGRRATIGWFVRFVVRCWFVVRVVRCCVLLEFLFCARVWNAAERGKSSYTDDLYASGRCAVRVYACCVFGLQRSLRVRSTTEQVILYR